jgi:hypothetical protein
MDLRLPSRRAPERAAILACSALRLLCVLAVAFGLTIKAQDTSEADSLNKQVIDLYRAGKYQEAIPIASR